jgi:hypothetical protein
MILTLPYELLGSGVFVKIEPTLQPPHKTLYNSQESIGEKYNPTKRTKENGIIQVLH